MIRLCTAVGGWLSNNNGRANPASQIECNPDASRNTWNHVFFEASITNISIACQLDPGHSLQKQPIIMAASTGAVKALPAKSPASAKLLPSLLSSLLPMPCNRQSSVPVSNRPSPPPGTFVNQYLPLGQMHGQALMAVGHL